MPEVWSPQLILAVGFAVFFYGASKTGLPVSGVLAGPVLAAALTPTIASGFAVPLLIVGDLIALAIYRQHVQWRLILRITPGVVVGFALTAVMFVFVEISTISRVVGGLILLTVILEWRRMSRGTLALEKSVADTWWDRSVTAFFGVLAGVTTMAANAGGTAMSLYLVRMRVSMLTFMGTSVWFFFILNVIKVPFIVSLGLITSNSLWANLAFLPVLLVGAVLGRALFKRLDQKTFVRLALAMSAIASLWLLWHG